MVRWTSTNYLSNLHQSGTLIRVKNIRRCPAQSHPHERTTSSILWKKTLKTRLDWPEKTTRERERDDFIQIYKIVHGLQKVNWCDKNRVPRHNQNLADRRDPYQLSRERIRENEPRTHFLLNRMATPIFIRYPLKFRKNYVHISYINELHAWISDQTKMNQW